VVTPEVLRRQATVLRPGGLVVANEADISVWRAFPETALMTQVMSWALEAFARAGMEQAGPRLWTSVEEAGLSPLGTIGISALARPDDEDGLIWMVQAVRAAVPLLVGTGVATAEEIDIETLEQRVRDEWKKTRMVFTAGMGVGVWATTGPE
jgi:hypothetical protein